MNIIQIFIIYETQQVGIPMIFYYLVKVYDSKFSKINFN